LLLTTTIVVLNISGKQPFELRPRVRGHPEPTGQEEAMTSAASRGDDSRNLFATPRSSPIAAPTAAFWCGRPRR
jgi:hypothetical protein